jgi:hypothetical protein
VNPVLEPIWESHLRIVDAFTITRRILLNPDLAGNHTLPLAKTEFDGLNAQDADARIDAAQEQLDDQTVLALYAAFESELRDHLIAQSVHLKTHATNPNATFAAALADEYESWCDDWKMNRVAKLFEPTVGTTLVAQVGQIRAYRHWVAHGKRRNKPAQTAPAFAYRTLDAFLSKV